MKKGFGPTANLAYREAHDRGSEALDAENSIEELLLATARGDRSAFRRLYEQSTPKLFGVVLRICRDRRVAEDALQDAFVDIWNRAGRFDPERGRGQAWMVVIARSRAIDALRRLARAPRTADHADAGERLQDTAPTGEAGVEFMALVQCLARLSPERREAVLAAYYTGATRDELAEQYGVSANTVKTWLRRSLAALRECLDE